jgi:hypothetical protein
MTECITMMLGIVVLALLIVAILLLGASALVKYLFFDRRGRNGTGNAVPAPVHQP